MDRINDRPGQPLAVVVGCGGLGMAVARRLGLSHKLLIADLDVAHLEQQVNQLQSEGHDAVGTVCDVTSQPSVQALAEQASRVGAFKALANVVGLSPTGSEPHRILQVNLRGAALIADSFLPLAMVGSAAVFVASVAPHLITLPDPIKAAVDRPLSDDLISTIEWALSKPLSETSAYTISKLGVIRLCRRLAPEWGARGARIVSLSPGLIDTPMGRKEFETQPSKHHMLARSPLARQCTMVEVAEVADFLVSDRASFITGTDLLVDGGLVGALTNGV